MSIFSMIPDENKIYSDEYFYIIKDSYPVSEGHLLIISKELKKDFFSLNNIEKQQLVLVIEIAKKIIEKDYSPDGYNIGMNCGESAGQTIFHFHCHIIPRYTGDMENPRGGIRHCIPGKGNY